MYDENINYESAENQEVAEPETETLEGAEEQEVAEPVEAEHSEEEVEDGVFVEDEDDESGRTEADAAFAEQRRTIEALQRENQMLIDSMSRYFDGETAEELSINANAYAEERDPDEYREEWERNQEYERAVEENEMLKEQLLAAEVDRRMDEALRELQEIDPNIKSLDDLGETFLQLVSAGASTKAAYYGSLAERQGEAVLAPDPIGRVADNRIERDYFTSEELDNLTDEDLDDPEIFEKAMKSLEKLPTKR